MRTLRTVRILAVAVAVAISAAAAFAAVAAIAAATAVVAAAVAAVLLFVGAYLRSFSGHFYLKRLESLCVSMFFACFQLFVTLLWNDGTLS